MSEKFHLSSDPRATGEEDLGSQLLDAAREGDLGRVASLLAQGADPNAFHERVERLPLESNGGRRTETVCWRETPLDHAIFYRHYPVINLLLERGARAEATSLARALPHNDLELLRRLLAHGADPNGVVLTVERDPTLDYDYWPCVLYLLVPVVSKAARDGKREAFLLLVAAGGKPSADDYVWMVELACSTGDPERVRPILEYAERTLPPLEYARVADAAYRSH